MKLTEEDERIIGGDCTSRDLKMKEYLPFCREFSILCIEDRVVVDSVI